MPETIQIREERPALHSRLLRVPPAEGASVLVYLEDGSLHPGSAVDPETDPITAPAYCHWPHPGPGKLILGPGSRATLLWLSDDIRQEAIGAGADSFDLRLLVDVPFVARLEAGETEARARVLVDWLRREIAGGAPSTMLLAAILRLVLIEAHRLHQPDASAVSGSEQTDLLRHFRHLVELHFADHWQIAQYADRLGVSYDRLHRICRSKLDRSPTELVNQRLTAEARDRLERSGAPLKKIASDLGFSDASRFSHFFKRRTGMAPGVWRAVAARSSETERAALQPGFADWP